MFFDKSWFRGGGEPRGPTAVVRREQGGESELVIVDNTWKEFLNIGEQEMGREIQENFFLMGEIPACPHAAGNNPGEERVTVRQRTVTGVIPIRCRTS